MSYNSAYDLLGKKVSDTYPNLLQSGSDGVFYDGRGNSVTINATIPDIYVKYSQTGSFATTASNTFIGNQTITGSIYMDAPGTDSIYFSQSGPAGRLVWNDTDGTLDLGLKGNNVTLQIGQEEVVRVVNKTGTNLTEAGYQAVRLDGAQGNRLKVALAKGDADGNSLDTLGLVTENIANNQEGFVTVSGLVRGINTTGNLQGESWADGDALYLSPTSFGGLTKIPPTAPSHSVRMGYVVQSNPSNGSIYVKVDNGYELDELHNVLINTASLSPGQLLVRDGLVWYNTNQLTGSYFVTGSIQATSFTGSISGNLTGTGSWAVSASQAISSSYSDTSQTTSTITVNSFGSNVESYLLMSNVVALPGVAIGGDADLRYNASTNRLSVGSVSATSLTGSLQGTASWADNATTASYILNAVSSSFASTASFAPNYLLVNSTSSMLAPYTLNSQTSSFVRNSQTGSFILTSSFNSFTASYSTGSFTGSFTGSLLGTASWANNAVTASYADTLDGIDSTQFARLDIDNTFNGVNTTTQKTLRSNVEYVITETSISTNEITGPDTQSIEVFNIYNLTQYTTDRPALNTAATFDYTLFDDTLTSIRSGRVNLSWTPNNAGQEAITDTQTIVNTGESSNIIFNSSVDYGIGSEFVKLNVINGASKPIYIRGFLRII